MDDTLVRDERWTDALAAIPGVRRAGALRAQLSGELLLPDDIGYHTARRVWNPAVDQWPAMIARCKSAADVASAVRFAREESLPVTVRSGGHSFAGFGVRDGAMMIDLSRLKAMKVQGGRRLATAQPGLTWGEFTRVAAACGLATTGADISTVGIGGMTLGGGMGWLHRVCGAACDNVAGADVVLADGSIVRASADDNPDLYWALRGGGGNFGIVTSLDYRLYRIDEIVGGIALHPLSRARDALALYRELCGTAPDALRLAVFLITAPPARFIPEEMRGKPVVMMCGAYFGPLDEGERALRPLKRFGPPTVDLIRRMRYLQLEHRAPPAGLHHHGTGEFLRALDEATIDALVDAAANTVSPFMIILVNQLGGAFSRVADGETPFGLRQAAHSVGIHCMWNPGDSPSAHEAWTHALWESLRPASAGGAAINLQTDEGDERVRGAYGPAVFTRLAQLKRRYDPENFFRVNYNIEPATAT
ncbi:MAG TPA: FAD-binding oxidoreductase [Gemmatimonadaceae bacterium]|nr:FAD-binding oxidoreductase [Gemmatimonadaceae bacterium]